MSDNFDFFRSLHALVTPERCALNLRGYADLDSLKIIHTRQGAGDRESGFGPRCADFDIILLPGQIDVDRLRDRGLQRGYGFPREPAAGGWPKFEAVQRLNPKPKRLFDNDRPIVVYALHFEEQVFSWRKMGEESWPSLPTTRTTI